MLQTQSDYLYRDHRLQGLFMRLALVNALYHVHARNDLAKGGEALAIGVTLAAKIQFGLVADANEEF